MTKPNRGNYLLDDHFYQLSPRMALMIGDRHAYILQQIHYWTRSYQTVEEILPVEDRLHFYQGRYWVYNIMDDWVKQFPWLSKRTLETIFSDLEGKGLLLSRKPDAKDWNHTKWYTVDTDKLDEMILIFENPNTDSAEIAESNPQKLRDQFRNNCGTYIYINNNHKQPTYPVGSKPQSPANPAPVPAAPVEEKRLYAGQQFTYQPPWEIGPIDEIDQKGDNSFTTIGHPKPGRGQSKKSQRLAAQPYSLFERTVLQAFGEEKFFNDATRKRVMEIESQMILREMIAERTGKAPEYPSMEFVNSTLLWAWKGKKAINQFLAAVENTDNWEQHLSFKQRGSREGSDADYESNTAYSNV